MEKIVSLSAEMTEKLGYELAGSLKTGDFVAMFGDLGAGKTAFTRGIAKRLCPGARVQSPTYTIVNEYKGSIPVFHFDMYRVDCEETLYSTGYFDYLGTGVCVVEWSENIREFIPERCITVTIEYDRSSGDDNKRIITIEDNR